MDSHPFSPSQIASGRRCSLGHGVGVCCFVWVCVGRNHWSAEAVAGAVGVVLFRSRRGSGYRYLLASLACERGPMVGLLGLRRALWGPFLWKISSGVHRRSGPQHQTMGACLGPLHFLHSVNLVLHAGPYVRRAGCAPSWLPRVSCARSCTRASRAHSLFPRVSRSSAQRPSTDTKGD